MLSTFKSVLLLTALVGTLSLQSCDDRRVNFANEADDSSAPTEGAAPPEIVAPTSEEVSSTGDGVDGSGPVPEPGTLLFVGSGLAAIGLMRRRRQKTHDGESAQRA